MANRLSGPELRQKLEQYVKLMSKLIWVLRITTLLVMVGSLVLLFEGRYKQAILGLLIFVGNFIFVIRHDLVVLMLRLLPQQDETPS
jgi:hypothetical protein